MKTVAYHFKPRSCAVCGCTDRWGCDEGCWWIGERLCSSCGDLCLDCEGKGTYPAGHPCKSCGGSGLVGRGEGIRCGEVLL